MHDRKAFTLIEVLVVVAIIALLVSVLLPSLAAARRQARAVVCMNNCKQIGLAAQMYAMQYKDTFPPSAHGGEPDPKTWWLHVLTRFIKTPLLFKCPEDSAQNFLDWSKALPPATELNHYRWASYAVNYLVVSPTDGDNNPITPYSERLSRIRRPQYVVLVGESQDSLLQVDHIHPERFEWRGGPQGQVATTRHNGRAHYLFVDSHVARLRIEETWEDGRRNWWDPDSAPAWRETSTPPPPPPPPPPP